MKKVVRVINNKVTDHDIRAIVGNTLAYIAGGLGFRHDDITYQYSFDKKGYDRFDVVVPYNGCNVTYKFKFSQGRTILNVFLPANKGFERLIESGYKEDIELDMYDNLPVY